MQGDIQVSSKLGEGAVFTVLLPLRRSSEAAALAGQSSPPPLLPYLAPFPASEPPDPSHNEHLADGSDHRPWVLIVEDHADVADYVAACVREHYQVILARNGQAGIERALEAVPDLIVSDVMMPEKDGFEVCESLKNDERTSHIPIVVLHAFADRFERCKMDHAGNVLFFENAPQGICMVAVFGVATRLLPNNLAQPLQHRRLRGREVVYDDGGKARLRQGHCGVAADGTGSAGDEDVHSL